jgi:hypothetical protein
VHPSTSRGWCHAHYQRWLRHGDVRAEVPLASSHRLCSIDGCGRQCESRQLCRAHYHRLMRLGDVRAEVPIRAVTGEGWITHGYRGVPVPPEDRHLTHGEIKELEHRLVMARILGRPLTADESVHHRNGDRLDNRAGNLELWSRWQPSGQKVEDKLAWALEILLAHRPDLLADT